MRPHTISGLARPLSTRIDNDPATTSGSRSSPRTHNPRRLFHTPESRRGELITSNKTGYTVYTKGHTKGS